MEHRGYFFNLPKRTMGTPDYSRRKEAARYRDDDGVANMDKDRGSYGEVQIVCKKGW